MSSVYRPAKEQEQLAGRLRQARRGMSQQLAARQLRVSHRSYSDWERGLSYPRYANLLRIEKWLARRQRDLEEGRP